MKVHYTEWSEKWDEWVDWDSSRLQKQWKQGDEFKLNNRIDVKDTYNKWLEATVVKVNSDKTIRVHYKGYTARWEEDLPFDSDRIARIGYKSSASGSGKTQKNAEKRAKQQKRFHEKYHDSSDDDESDKRRKEIQRENEEFEEQMKQLGYKVVEIAGDGN